jgi:hypothetical protein
MNVSRRGQAEIKRILLTSAKGAAGMAMQALLESLGEAIAQGLDNVAFRATSTARVQEKVRTTAERHLATRVKKVFSERLREVASQTLLEPSAFAAEERQRLNPLLNALKRPLKPSSVKVREWARRKYGSYRIYRWGRLDGRKAVDLNRSSYGVDTGSLARMLGSSRYTSVKAEKVRLEGWRGGIQHGIDRPMARKLMAGMRSGDIAANKALLVSLLRKEQAQLYVSYRWIVKGASFAPAYYQIFAKQPRLNILENKGVAAVALFRALQSKGALNEKPRT